MANLMLKYLPTALLRRHCRDVNYWNHSHADSTVFSGYFSGVYTVQELEAAGLWDRLEAKIQSLGGCEAINYHY
jgi:hypothetical protein